MKRIIKIHANDNVAVTVDQLEEGDVVSVNGVDITVNKIIPSGHKFAIAPIEVGEPVMKYGFPIGSATSLISVGDHVHVKNVKTLLSGTLEYSYTHEGAAFDKAEPTTFMGFNRENGKVGIRNEIWIVNTVGCVNKTSEIIARQARNQFAGRGIDGIYEIQHPYGCSQMGDDQLMTQQVLAGLVKHPNAAGVLVLGLGCENNNIGEFKKVLGETNSDRVKFLVAQEADDEIEEALAKISDLVDYAEKFKREPIPVSKLIVGLKCGGSDGFSGITANPLLGAFSDKIIAQGGTSILTEVPEMFGAETLLMNRCKDEATFNKCVDLINGFKHYYEEHNQVVYDNPSPGNKAGGITTLEDKSLGCTQKGGTAQVVDVLRYGQLVENPGLNLLEGPGNDIVAVTNLIAAGAHIVLFTTGRGTPLGGPAPTLKVSSNTALAEKKKHWIDFNAGVLLEGKTMPEVADEFFDLIVETASGKETKSEINGYREIAIFKDGVTL